MSRSSLFSEPQNHRLVGAGRDLWGSPSPTPLPKQGHPEQAAQDHVQEGFDYLQRRFSPFLKDSMRGKKLEQDLTPLQLCWQWQQQRPSPHLNKTGPLCDGRPFGSAALSSPHGLLSEECCIVGSGLHMGISLN